MFHLVRGSVYLLIVVGASFSFFFLYIGLVTIWNTLFLYFLYSDVRFSFHLSLHVLFLFFLYTHVSYIMYAIYYFWFIGCQSLLVINSLLAKFFKSCIRIDFIVFNKWIWVEWFMTSLISHLLVVVLSRIAKVGDCWTYVIHLLGIYVTILCNWLIFWQNALYLYLDRFRMRLIVTTKRKALATSALYLKRTSHNWGSL